MRFLRRFLACLLLCAALVFLAFGTVNPFGWFWGTHFLTTTPITRARKQVLFEAWNRKAPVEGLVLGSSQSMKLDPGLLTQRTGFRYFNFAVSAGTIEDAYALIDYAEQNRAPLRAVILGVDPWMFNDGELPTELQSDWVLPPHVGGKRPTFLWKIGHGIHLFAESMTLSYAKEVLVSIRVTRHGLEPLHSFYDNGYMVYPDRERRKAAGTYNLESKLAECLEALRHDPTETLTFDSAQFRFFERTLERARKQGIAVTIWIPPRIPRYYRVLDSLPGYETWRSGAIDSIRTLARKHGVRFVDLSFIDSFGGDSLDWYDCLHYGPGNASRIVERLLAPDSTTRN